MIAGDVCYWGSKIEDGDLIHLFLMLILVCSLPVLSVSNGVNPLWSSSFMSYLGHKWAYSFVNNEATASLALRQLLISFPFLFLSHF